MFGVIIIQNRKGKGQLLGADPGLEGFFRMKQPPCEREGEHSGPLSRRQHDLGLGLWDSDSPGRHTCHELGRPEEGGGRRGIRSSLHPLEASERLEEVFLNEQLHRARSHLLWRWAGTMPQTETSAFLVFVFLHSNASLLV